MHFSVLPPEVNSALLVTGDGSGPMLAAAAAWDGIGTELSSAASGFSSVTSDLTGLAWQGPASASMMTAVAPYVGWLESAAAQAEQSATQARSAAAAYEAALTTIVHPGLIADNRGQLVSLVQSNLFGQNAPAIAATEAAYEQMWAQNVTVMSGYHTSASAAVAQLGSWGQALENLPGPAGQVARAVANGLAFVQQEIQQTSAALATRVNGAVNSLIVDIFGSPPSAPIPATQYPTFTGTPSLANRIEVAGLWVEKDFLGIFGIDLTSTFGPLTTNPLIAPFLAPFVGNLPPKLLTLLLGETVQQSTYNGMAVVQITPAHPSGDYVVAIHGGGLVLPPSLFHWIDYTAMAYLTGATIEVPIYPLAQQGGTAGVVVPTIAGLISTEIAAHGASNVSVYGDSSGGGIALAAVEYLVATNQTVPASMVLLSPWTNLAVNNPNIAFVHDPLLSVGPGQQIGKEWAGNLPINNYMVSPLDGTQYLHGLPPTYVYSGTLDILGPDALVLAQEAVTYNAPISFVLHTGEIHDWVLLSPDGIPYLPQIYQELGI